MIILDLNVNNMFAFENFHINFSYPKKIVGSTIENEFLKGYPNFRYKKLIAVMGANATGKTSLGKTMMAILNFINRREYKAITEIVENHFEPANFSMDFVANDYKFYRITTIIDPCDNRDYNSNDIHTWVKSTSLKKDDKYESCAERIDVEMANDSMDSNLGYISELEKIGPLSWMFKYAEHTAESIKIAPVIDENRYLSILRETLKVLDPRIVNVNKIDESIYLIKYPCRNVVINDGLVESDKISSGTKEGIGVAHMLAAIKCGIYKFFYCDEKFSHIHSESEKAFLSLIVDCLGDDHQFFITSHNTDILDMNLPKHSFVFLKRNADGAIDSCIWASEFLKRNTDSLKNAVENDLFGAAPDVDEVYRLKEI